MMPKIQNSIEISTYFAKSFLQNIVWEGNNYKRGLSNNVEQTPRMFICCLVQLITITRCQTP